MHKDPSILHLKPRFTFDSSRSIDDICDDFRCRLASSDSTFDGKVTYRYVNIYPSAKERHYWSPHFSLSMEVNEGDQNHTKVSGIYGPAPEVWTMFVFIYGVIGLCSIIVTVVGLANLTIGESGQILWLVPLFLIGFSTMYLVSYFGQRKGHNQIEGIYAMIEQVIFSKDVSSD